MPDAQQHPSGIAAVVSPSVLLQYLARAVGRYTTCYCICNHVMLGRRSNDCQPPTLYFTVLGPRELCLQGVVGNDVYTFLLCSLHYLNLPAWPASVGPHKGWRSPNTYIFTSLKITGRASTGLALCIPEGACGTSSTVVLPVPGNPRAVQWNCGAFVQWIKGYHGSCSSGQSIRAGAASLYCV